MTERQVEKKRIGSMMIMIAMVLLVIIVLSVKITTITVSGNERYTSEQIIDLIFSVPKERNTAYCYYNSVAKPHKKIPFVEDYKIIFNGLNDVEIIVYEKSVVGYVSYMSSYMYFDKDGIIVESASSRLEGIPQITGLDFGQVVLYQPLPVTSQAIFGEILNLTQIMSSYDFGADTIKFDSYGNATLYMDGIEVVLGGNEGLNGKISELNDILPQITGLSGTLFLDTYSENSSNLMFRFMPDS